MTSYPPQGWGTPDVRPNPGGAQAKITQPVAPAKGGGSMAAVVPKLKGTSEAMKKAKKRKAKRKKG